MDKPAPGIKWTGFDPYAIGLLLGDGTTGGKHMTLYTCDDWIRDYMDLKHGWKSYDYRPKQNAMMVQCIVPRRSDEWKDAVGRYKGADKRIPQALLDADPDARLACLQGLMDADGSVDTGGRCSFSSISTHLAEGVQYLVRSLGGKCDMSWSDRRPTSRENHLGYWRVRIMHCNKFNPFRMPRKVERVKPMKGPDRRIVSITQVEDGSATCFEVEHPSHLFVCQDFIVTHNTLTLVMDFAKDVGKGYGKAWRGVLFRQKLGDLDDVVRKNRRSHAIVVPRFPVPEVQGRLSSGLAYG
jgi:replicative DNA helicase